MRATTITRVKAGDRPWRDRVVHPMRGTGTRTVVAWEFWGVEWDGHRDEQVNYALGPDGAPYDRQLREIGR